MLDFPFVSGFLSLGVYWSSEVFLRRGKARDVTQGPFDRGSSLLLFSLGVLIIAAAVVVRFTHIPGRFEHGAVVLFAFLAVVFLAVAVRFWAMRVLGEQFARTLSARVDQEIITSGPYRFIRHPGYLGDVLIFTAFSGLVSANWLFLLSAVVALAICYGYRIRVEERMLLEVIGPRYAEYQRRTSRLVPGLL